MSEEKNLNMNETSKLYELSVNIVSTITEDNVSKEFDAIKDQLKKINAEIVSESAPQKITLQYTMIKKIDSTNHKHDQAYFGWIKFVAETNKIIELREELDLHENILRYLITISQEDTNISAEKVAEILNDDGKGKKEVDAETEEQVDTNTTQEGVAEESAEPETDREAVDKAIDDLVEESK